MVEGPCRAPHERGAAGGRAGPGRAQQQAVKFERRTQHATAVRQERRRLANALHARLEADLPAALPRTEPPVMAQLSFTCNSAIFLQEEKIS